MTRESANPRAESRGLGTIERIYRTWGRHPRLYAIQDLLTFLGRHRNIRRRAVQALRACRGARVLEVACGTGRNFPYVEDAIGPGGTLVAVDYSREMLRAAEAMAARRRWHNIWFVHGDAANLEVGTEPFDAVLCVLGLSAMPGHMAALERCKDVLRRGGILAVCDARPFSGALARLNRLLRAIYVPASGWNPDRDVIGDMERMFGNVAAESFNAGTMFVAWSEKQS